MTFTKHGNQSQSGQTFTMGTGDAAQTLGGDTTGSEIFTVRRKSTNDFARHPDIICMVVVLLYPGRII